MIERNEGVMQDFIDFKLDIPRRELLAIFDGDLEAMLQEVFRGDQKAIKDFKESEEALDDEALDNVTLTWKVR